MCRPISELIFVVISRAAEVFNELDFETLSLTSANVVPARVSKFVLKAPIGIADLLTRRKEPA